MKSFSFKILYISLFVPSILYVLTLPAMETFLQKQLSTTVRQQLIRKHNDLLDGSVSLYDEINVNITEVLRESRAAQLGSEFTIRVRTASGTILYPKYDRLLRSLQQEKMGLPTGPGPLFGSEGYLRHPANTSLEALLEEYSSFIQGLQIEVTATIPATSWFGGSLLLLFIFLVVLFLYLYYQHSRKLDEASLQKISAEMRLRLEQEKQDHASQVNTRLAEAQERLADIKRQEEEWLREVERLEAAKAALEEELLETLERSEDQQEQLHHLEEEVAKKESRRSKSAGKEEASLAERFNKLYRNLEIDRAAVRGFVELQDEKNKLAAEEMLKRLNDGDANLKVRRKIAGVAGVDAFELGFGAKGRIYYLHSKSQHFRVARIGTKSTQNKDLAALQGLSA